MPNEHHDHVHGYVSDHHHDHGHTHSHDEYDVNDYANAVKEYRKTFPDKQDVMEKTPDPAVREMIRFMDEIGLDTSWDRFDQQKPQCTFGLAGICCRICNMGPCKITAKSPRGVCGADADLIVARNLLRSVAGGTAQHGAHAREVILSLKWAGEGKLDRPILGAEKLRTLAQSFQLEIEGKSDEEVAVEFADVLLDDMSRPEASEYKTIRYCAPPERQKVWEDLGILPISTYQEVFEAMHRTGEACDGDWQSIMTQFLRTGLAYTFGTVVNTNLATDSLFGLGKRRKTMVNMGAIEKGYVNIAIHGHLPTLVSEIVELGHSEEYDKLAKEAGAEGIRFYGICCSGLSALYRYDGVVPLCNPPGAELVLGTGALDLWVADVQDIYPGIMDVAKCFKTVVVTTNDSTRLPGDEHIAYDYRHSNIGETHELARKILDRGIRAYTERRRIPTFIPPYEVEAETGFTVENLTETLGGTLQPLADAIREGKVLGIVDLVGCTNPKVIYERAIVDVATSLIENNVLILTNGCASFPLLKLGFCNANAREMCGDGLHAFLDEYDLPPALHVGECIDNTRSTGVLSGVAGILESPLKDMPFAMSSPEWANEKGVGAGLAFRLLGLNSYHCVEAPIYGSDNVMRFMKEDTKDMLGSVMVVDTDAKSLAARIISDMKEKRAKLGWD
ncbi:MAG: anaerobic carbon-monoxide dehydrogenase catalytic subunit [Actinomycetota bacterium]|nr:anaerobic carbon-monoxide dehydrogenase catalytic subunit [Actinomycetota bacterium]